MGDADEARLVAFYQALVGATEDQVGDALLTGPRLTPALARRPAVVALLLRGLGAGVGPTLQRHLVRSLGHVLENDENVPLPPEVWLGVVQLLGTNALDVAQPAAELVVRFGTQARLRGSCEAALVAAAQHDAVTRLRVLEVATRLAAKEAALLDVPAVRALLVQLVAVAQDPSDPLTQLSALEVLSMHAVTQPWTLQVLLDAQLLARASEAVRRAGGAGIADGALLRLAASVAAQGEDGYRAVETTGWLDVSMNALHLASEVSEARLDGAISVVEGAARGCGAGRARVAPLVDPLAALVRGGETVTRIRACHGLCALLEASSEDATIPTALAAAAAAQGLGARLLSLAQQPLLTEQRSVVFALLAQLVLKMPEWVHRTTPSLLPYVMNRNLDQEKEAVEWRYAIAKAFVTSKGAAAAALLLGDESMRLLNSFLMQGPWGANAGKAKPDVGEQTGH